MKKKFLSGLVQKNYFWTVLYPHFSLICETVNLNPTFVVCGEPDSKYFYDNKNIMTFFCKKLLK